MRHCGLRAYRKMRDARAAFSEVSFKGIISNLWGPIMKIRSALLGAAGLVALSLPAHAAGSATIEDAPLVKSNTTKQQLAQRPYDPSAGGFAKTKKKDGMI